jgi:hypothetical protein
VALRGLWLWRGNAESWGLVPLACERIEAFAQKYGGDYPPGVLSRMLQANFTADAPRVLACLGLEGEKVVAHLLAQIETWGARTYVGIVQLEAEKRIPKQLALDHLAMLEAWGQAYGATGFTILCRNDTVARLFRRLGFSQKHVHMTRSFGHASQDIGRPPTPTQEIPITRGTDTIYTEKT